MNYCNSSVVLVLLVVIGAPMTISNTTTTKATTTPTTPTAAITTATKTMPTTSGACEDLPGVNCTKLKPYCSDHQYDDLLNKFCRRTCDRCGGTTSTACFDCSKDCNAWNQHGFCNSTFYSTEIKRHYCAMTCRLC